MSELLGVGENRAEKLVLKSHSELVLETVTPVGLVGQLGHCAHEAAREELFGDVEALKFVHSFDLLFSLSTGVVQSLVLLLDERNLALDLLLPLRVVVLLSLGVLLFELAYLLELSLFLHLQNSLFAGLSQEDVKDGLHFSIVLKKVIVTDLGGLIDSCLLRDVLG